MRSVLDIQQTDLLHTPTLRIGNSLEPKTRGDAIFESPPMRAVYRAYRRGLTCFEGAELPILIATPTIQPSRHLTVTMMSSSTATSISGMQPVIHKSTHRGESLTEYRQGSTSDHRLQCPLYHHKGGQRFQVGYPPSLI